jgi:hypothetical protein
MRPALWLMESCSTSTIGTGTARETLVYLHEHLAHLVTPHLAGGLRVFLEPKR